MKRSHGYTAPSYTSYTKPRMSFTPTSGYTPRMTLEGIGRIIMAMGLLLAFQFFNYIVFNMVITRMETDTKQPFVAIAIAIGVLLFIGFMIRFLKSAFLFG